MDPIGLWQGPRRGLVVTRAAIAYNFFSLAMEWNENYPTWLRSCTRYARFSHVKKLVQPNWKNSSQITTDVWKTIAMICARMEIDGRAVGKRLCLKKFNALRYIWIVDTCWCAPLHVDGMVVSWSEWEWGSAREVVTKHLEVQA